MSSFFLVIVNSLYRKTVRRRTVNDTQKDQENTWWRNIYSYRNLVSTRHPKIHTRSIVYGEALYEQNESWYKNYTSVHPHVVDPTKNYRDVIQWYRYIVRNQSRSDWLPINQTVSSPKVTLSVSTLTDVLRTATVGSLDVNSLPLPEPDVSLFLSNSHYVDGTWSRLRFPSPQQRSFSGV